MRHGVDTGSCMNSFVSYSVETYGGMHAGAVRIVNSIAIASQAYGIIDKRCDIVYGLRTGVACAIHC